MLYTRTAVERGSDSGNSFLPPIASDLRRAASTDQARYAAERALDQVLADSFPASDPPSWTLGVAQPASSGYMRSTESADETATAKSDGEAARV